MHGYRWLANPKIALPHLVGFRSKKTPGEDAAVDTVMQIAAGQHQRLI
jgi:hypothetical protein